MSTAPLHALKKSETRRGRAAAGAVRRPGATERLAFALALAAIALGGAGIAHALLAR
ncbi:hypothetical protein [Solimonas flava]|uniref:hypothetical protein n=1 Tax=Solimonas flava TaxID=415849 RepID=UPI0004191C26|nr:hypothetical protein [Solimonas flava]